MMSKSRKGLPNCFDMEMKSKYVISSVIHPKNKRNGVKSIYAKVVFQISNIFWIMTRAVDFRIQSFLKSESNDSIYLKSIDKII